MPKCVRCDKKGLFLKVDDKSLCEKCVKELANVIVSQEALIEKDHSEKANDSFQSGFFTNLMSRFYSSNPKIALPTNKDIETLHKDSDSWGDSDYEAYERVHRKIRTATGPYYELMDNIENYFKKGDYSNAAAHCQASLPFLEPLVKWQVAEFKSFDITSIPAIERACILYAIHNHKGQLKNIEEVIDNIPELKPWAEEVSKAYEMNRISIKIQEFLINVPGFRQNKLKVALNEEDGQLVGRVCRYMEKFGKMTREKQGSTNTLNLTEK